MVSDQIGLDQLLASQGPLRRGHLPRAADRVVGGVTQTAGIGDGEQEQVKSPGGVAATTEVMIAHQPMINPTETGGDLAEPIRAKGPFVDHEAKVPDTSLGADEVFPP